MSKDATPEASQLADALREIEDFVEVDDLARLVAPVINDGPDNSARRFLLGPVHMRIADQLDLVADAVVHDGILGSLGLIHLLPGAPAEEAWFRQRIDQAAYLRHLLLSHRQPGELAERTTVYAVEVVFVLTGSNAAAAESIIGDLLRRILRESGYLHAVGVNVWQPGAGGRLTDPATRRRALSWLLIATRNWYQGAAVGEDGVKARLLHRLTLQNFRVPGTRHWNLAPEHRLHLVHGHNGSGKSSLCEALELLITGRVERLGTDHDLVAKALINQTAREQAEPCTVALQSDGEETTWSLSVDGLQPEPLAQHLSPASFRLDQMLGDRLSQGSAAERAKLFLEAFFPAEGEALSAQRSAWERARGAFDKLPPALRAKAQPAGTGLDLEAISKEYGWVHGESLPWEKVVALLPLSAEQFSAVGPLLPQPFIERYQRTGEFSYSQVEEDMRVLDDALRGLFQDLERKLDTLGQASALLEEYAEASVGAAGPAEGELAGLLNEWLELLAYVDLAEKEHLVCSTIETARASGYKVDGRRLRLVASGAGSTAAERERALEALRQRRDELRMRVASFTTQAEIAASEHRALKPLEAFNLAALDEAAHLGAFGEPFRSASPALSVALADAFARREAVTVSSGNTPLVSVGTPGWGKEMLGQVQNLRQAFQDLAARQRELADPLASLTNLLPSLRELNRAATDFAKAGRDLVERFLAQVGSEGPLSHAINELMALLTPARWAYQDVVTRAQVAEGELRQDYDAPGGVAAKYRLNTAELNILALTLFLLCARRSTANPLRTVVLDDPLQNFDELTVTTLARGLGRLLRLWQRMDTGHAPWSMLLTVHGEENLERIRNEIHCAAYFLPWLSPHAGSDQSPPIEPAPSLLKDDLQPLHELIQESPVLRGVA